MKDEYSISIITPVYNEVGLLENSISYINTFIGKYFKDYEIIIIESGSTDSSFEVCDKLAKSDSHIKVIHEGSRNGFGSALKLGYKSAVKDLVWLITVDMPFSLESILQALPLFSKYDCVLSYRYKDDRGIARKIQSFVYNNIVKLSLGLKVKHVNSAFKVFRKEIIQNMNLISNGWFIDAEILYRIKERNISYTEIPVELIHRTAGESSIRLSTPLSLLKELVYFLRNKDK
jgi:glycosyltransferase involved in cell wall biosynthesis